MTTEKGLHIRQIRQRLRMTQEDFAHALAVTASTVNRWENSHTVPSRLARRAIETLVQSHGSRPAGVVGGPDVHLALTA